MPSFGISSFQDKLFKNFLPNELQNQKQISYILDETHIRKRTKRSQRGLFHGIQPKTGNMTCFSEKKTRRWWKPNIIKRTFHSDILNKDLQIEVSTKAFRCIRKYGGFDNYILLTKTRKMDSIYGEYLRKLMLTKLNDQSFKVPYIVRSKRIKSRSSKQMKIDYQKQHSVWHPKEIRHSDLSHLKVKLPHEMSRKELTQYNELIEMDENLEDINIDHPFIKQLEKEKLEQQAILEPIGKEAIEWFDKKHKDKKAKEKIRNLIEEGIKEFQNPPPPKNIKDKKGRK